jgi:tripartite-type tricarboxylate transporter receptor subunit TctC
MRLDRTDVSPIARALTLALAIAASGFTAVHAQLYPSKPVKIYQGFAVGGNADTIGRLVAQGLTEELGQPFLVEAKTGAGGNIASDFVAKSAADGYSLVLLTGGHAVSAAMYKTLAFDPLNDFKWLSLVTVFPFVIGTSVDSKIKTIADLIATARSEPDKLSFSSVGIGTTQHLAGELLQSTAKIKMLHIPYRGGGAPVQDVITGRVDILFDSVTVSRAQVAGGKLRALGVTSTTRIPQLPDVPAVAETLPGFNVTSWAAIAAPAGLPAEITDRLHAAIAKTVAKPDVGKRLFDLGGLATSSTPEETAKHVAREIETWKRVVDQASIPKQ